MYMYTKWTAGGCGDSKVQFNCKFRDNGLFHSMSHRWPGLSRLPCVRFPGHLKLYQVNIVTQSGHLCTPHVQTFHSVKNFLRTKPAQIDIRWETDNRPQETLQGILSVSGQTECMVTDTDGDMDRRQLLPPISVSGVYGYWHRWWHGPQSAIATNQCQWSVRLLTPMVTWTTDSYCQCQCDCNSTDLCSGLYFSSDICV